MNSASTRAALPSTTPTTSTTVKLRVGVLSAYDLPSREPPIAVTVQVGSTVLKTGPPSQRHKDRNSFKFNNNTNTNEQQQQQQQQVLTFTSDHLPSLYNSTAVISVVYANSTQHNNREQRLTARYALHQLRIHETAWLVLQLHPEDSTNSDDNNNNDDNDDDDDDVPPTLRLQMTLDGPYRTEIGWIIQAMQSWFHGVDRLEDFVKRNVRLLPPQVGVPVLPFDSKFILIPAVPFLAMAVVSTPIWMGILTVALPVALPIFVLLALVVGILLVSCGVVLASTAVGREYWTGYTAPVAHTLLSTPAGQRLVYHTGPRPNPVTVAQAILPRNMWGRLLVSLLVDALGSASYLLPGVGEIVDVAWAPIQTVFIMALYDETSPNLKYLSFIEELLPFTDIVPSASIGWLAEYAVPWLLPPSPPTSKNTAKQQQQQQQQQSSWIQQATTTTAKWNSDDGAPSTFLPSTPVRTN